MKLYNLICGFLMSIFVLNSYAAERVLLFIGDSLTEGYGVEKSESYPQLIQSKLDQKFGVGTFKVLNGSVSGSTSASGLSRLNWFKKSNPELLVLGLGANDGLRGVTPKMTKANLKKIIVAATDLKMKVLLLGMMMPPNYGPQYTDEFKAIYPELSKEHSIGYVPFVLDGVAGEKSLNQGDGIHPNSKGHLVISETVWKSLEKML